MIDLHCHILPGLDDGAVDMSVSLEMARQAVKQGIECIVATPHIRSKSYNVSKSKVKEAVQSLNEELTNNNIPLTVYPGHEVRVTSAFEDEFYGGEYCYLDEQGKYILIEFSSIYVSETAEQLIHNLYCDDVTPVIAHPERNAIFHTNPDLLCTLVEVGALAQITAGSLIGKFGKQVQKFSYQLVKNNIAHVIASDAHNISSRGFFMREAYEKIGKIAGEHTKRSLEENAQLLFSGSSIEKRQPMPITRRIFPRMF